MDERDSRGGSAGTKLLIELGPLIVFFVTFKLRDIFWATGVFMVAISLALIAARRIEKRWPPMLLVSAVLVLVLGGLTLILQDSTFVKIKPTFVYGLFAAVLLGGLATGRVYLELVFDGAVKLRDEGWRVLTLRFGVFFVLLAVLNELVWRNMSEGTWVKLKVFGFLPLTLLFMVLQGGLLQRYALEEEAAEGGASPSPAPPGTDPPDPPAPPESA